MQIIFLTGLIYTFLLVSLPLTLFILGLAISSELLLLLNTKEKRQNLRLILYILLNLNLAGIFWLYSTNYYDVLMHLSWGALIGAVLYRPIKKATKQHTILKTILAVFLIGVIWEVGEFTFDLLFSSSSSIGLMQPSKLDTIKDLILDVVGAMIGTNMASSTH